MDGTIWNVGTGQELQVSNYGAWSFGAADVGDDGRVVLYVEVLGVPQAPMNGKVWSGQKFMAALDGGSPSPPACGTAPQVNNLGLPWSDPWEIQDYWVVLGCAPNPN
jgi:hypothetical protein